MSLEAIKINQLIGKAISRQLDMVELINREDPDSFRAVSARGKLAGLRQAYEIVENSRSGCF